MFGLSDKDLSDVLDRETTVEDAVRGAADLVLGKVGAHLIRKIGEVKTELLPYSRPGNEGGLMGSSATVGRLKGELEALTDLLRLCHSNELSKV